MSRPFLARYSRVVTVGALPELDKITTETGSTYYSEKFLSREVTKYTLLGVVGGSLTGMAGLLFWQSASK